MVTESFLVTALPRTADPDQQVHVSLFVSHRLTPDGAEGVLGDFAHVSDWTSELLGAEVALVGYVGGVAHPIPATPLLGVLETAVWPRVFPEKLTVRAWQTADPASLEWRSFPAHRMQQHALLAHAGALFSSPVDSPPVGGNALTGLLLGAIGLGQFERRLPLDLLLGDEVDIDEWATNFLDDVTGGGRHDPGGADDQPLIGLTADVHRARRYYQRPEADRPYRAEPVPGATRAPVVKPVPDFHERVGMIGDLSPLLRRLGLVIDLHVDDVDALAGVTEIAATVTVPGLANPVPAQPRTSCVVDGHGFWAASASGDHHRGMLRLGDEERYRVLDLDPDASALKLEQYVRTLPRMLATELNGDAVTSAPPGLRASGLAVARVDRSDHLQEQLADIPSRDLDLLAGKAPPQTIEALARGLRLEVWDDVSAQWHSLHRRRIDVEVDGAGMVLSDAADTGFLQGAALARAEDADGQSPDALYYAHEVLAGWEGWSLSVPRPGKVVVHQGGDEVVVDAPNPDPDPVNPVATTSRIEPLTLPWLRYGRSYSFRAWTVDLAGNSAPHHVAGPGGDDSPKVAPAPAATRGRRRERSPHDDGLDARLDDLADRAAHARITGLDPDATSSGAAALREQIRALHPVEQPGPRRGQGAGGLDLEGFSPTGIAEVDVVVRARTSERAGRRPPPGPTRRERVESAFHESATQVAHLLKRTDTALTHSALATAVAEAVRTMPELPPVTGGVVTELLDLVTTPRPFLRWDPVVEPAVVPRHPYTEAESQLTLVIRSGVAVPDPTGDPYTVDLVAPDDYAQQTRAAHPELDLLWRGTSQRHLASPKTSQLEAELHGHFDAAIGGAGAAAVRRALAVALRESGSFLSTTVADLHHPGARLPQPGVELHSSPTAQEPAVTDPADLARGAPLTKGQYVVHDTDDLILPYLPDPLAKRLSLTFPDAGQGHHLFGLWAIEGVTLPYAGRWPEWHPYRLVLEAGAELAARSTRRVVRVAVPPGEQLRVNLSSALDRADLDLLGLWRSLPQAIRDLDVVAEAAADGWLWWLTPPTQLRLVHAVPKPVEVPRTTILVPVRVADGTDVRLFGGVDVHGPSTERLDVEAAWTEWVDDPTKPGPEQVDVTAAAAHTAVSYDEDLVVLGGEKDSTFPLPDGSALQVHAAVHQLGDTRHRLVEYRMRATTRYREYFDPRVLPTVDDVSVVGPATQLDVPNTARPNKPVVHDVIPLFRWTEETEPAQPFGLRRTRRAGLRVYLERPWFSSGDGELLGVLLAVGPDTATENHVSQWGGDPAYLQAGPASRSVLPLSDLTHLVGLDDRREGGRPVGPPALQTLVDAPGTPAVWVLGYQPEFSAERGMWFVDVALDPGTAIWPFVRLGLARFQPSSLPGKHLSPVVRTDFVPLPPERTATVTRPDRRHARVVVTGPIGVPDMGPLTGDGFVERLLASRTMRARLERRRTDLTTDLGWETVDAVDLPVLGFDATVVSWSGQLPLPTALPPRRPGSNQTFRVVLEEWETLPADARGGGPGTDAQSRVVYADHLPL